MDLDESLVQKITDMRPSWTVRIRQSEFVPDSVEIFESIVPVKRPDTRGGVYFSQTKAYKVTCVICDTSITSILTSVMLGPNTDFTPIELAAVREDHKFLIRANLTNYVQTATGIRLSLLITDVSN